jgi:hypothetical protein
MNMLMLPSFALFTGLVGVITYLKTRKDNTASKDGYCLGGRSLTGGVIGGSLMLINLSAPNFLGMNAQSYSGKRSVMGWKVGSDDSGSKKRIGPIFQISWSPVGILCRFSFHILNVVVSGEKSAFPMVVFPRDV